MLLLPRATPCGIEVRFQKILPQFIDGTYHRGAFQLEAQFEYSFYITVSRYMMSCCVNDTPLSFSLSLVRYDGTLRPGPVSAATVKYPGLWEV